MSAAPIALGITGASGIVYGLRLLQCLLESGRRVQLMISPAAQVVAAQETDLRLPSTPRDTRDMLVQRFNADAALLEVYGANQWFAPLASGSNAPEAMVICPCSSGTLAAIAGGASDNLLERAADVALKERRTLIVVPREMPLSPIHLENMLKLARLGVVVMPASPGFYHRPESVDGLVDFVVARILDHLGVAQTLVPRWGERAGDDGGHTP
jgi:4-hydroxy-3-polyprenylbenzoate decarboxylase